MYKKRITTEDVDAVVNNVLDIYKMVDAQRPNGEYVNGSRFTFVRTEKKLKQYPKKWTLVDTTEGDEVSFEIEYDKFEDSLFYKSMEDEIKYNVIKKVKEGSALLSEEQMMTIINEYVHEVFTPSYIEKHQQFFDAKITQIATFARQKVHKVDDKYKPELLYAILEDETQWIPTRKIFDHFSFIYSDPNPYIERDDFERVIHEGSVYYVQLPYGYNPEFGGGLKRHCLIVGPETSRGEYPVVPLCHSRKPEPEYDDYIVGEDDNGQFTYAIDGHIVFVPASDIYGFKYKVDKDTYSRITTLINRDIKVKSTIDGPSTGIFGLSKEDSIRRKLNRYDKNFTFPAVEVLAGALDVSLKYEEKKCKQEMYEKDETGKIIYEANCEDDFIEIKFKVKDNEKFPYLTTKFLKSKPVDVFSNRKVLRKNDYENQGLILADQSLANAYHYKMNGRDSLFKYFMLKRLVGAANRAYKENHETDPTIRAEYLQGALKGCKLVYEGDLAALVAEGSDKIVYSLLHHEKKKVESETVVSENNIDIESGDGETENE